MCVYADVCSALFVIELLLKLYALRLHYFGIFWNRFDFGIVMLTIAEYTIYFASHNEAIRGVLTVFRTLRLMKLSKHFSAW